MREGVGLAHAGCRLVLQRKIEAGEIERPSSLPAIELLRDVEVFEVLVVCEDLNWMAGPFKVVAPFFETSNYRQHFHVVALIVAFDRTCQGTTCFPCTTTFLPITSYFLVTISNLARCLSTSRDPSKTITDHRDHRRSSQEAA